ncbi:MAG: 3-deoxy-7-phosphoheptulonate synthase, partial [Chloroflexi bacterium]
MIVVMRPDHSPEQVQAVMDRLVQFGLQGQPIRGVEREVIAGLGQVLQEHRDEILMMPGVDEVIRVSKPYKLSSREVHPRDTIVELPYGVKVGGGRPVFMAGPCAIESEDQLMAAARGVRKAGAHVLRGGAFKPRSSPYSFQGLGLDALKLLRTAGDEVGMPVITECLSERDVEACAQYSDVLHIGARNMQNFVLLQEAGKTGKPVLLKRGMSATIEEWLLASEYVMSQNNPNLIL